MSVTETKVSQPSSSHHGGNAGIVVPVGTTAQRESSPKQGTLRGNTSLKTLEFYMGNLWLSFQPKRSVEPTVTGSMTARPDAVYPVNTQASEITIRLPTNAEIGATVTLIDLTNTWDENNCIIDPNGSTVDGNSGLIRVNNEGAVINLIYVGASGWVSNIPKSGPVQNIVTSSDWPINLRANEEYYFELDDANENEVTLPANAKTGNRVTLTATNNVMFSQVNLTVKTADSAQVEGQSQLTLAHQSTTVSFVFLANQWQIDNFGFESLVLHQTKVTSGSLNSMIAKGVTKLSGNMAAFSAQPDGISQYSKLYATLDVSYTEDIVIQELTTFETISGQHNTRRFLRTGRLNSGGSVTFSSKWTELQGKTDGSQRIITNPDNLYDDLLDGSYYVVNPTAGTPDHDAGDVYMVEVTSSGRAQPSSQVSYASRFIRVWNIKKRQWWETQTSSLTEIEGWRKVNGNITLEIRDGQVVDYSPHAPVTNIWVTSEGNQRINLKSGLTVETLGCSRVGDVVVVHNLRENVGVTTITSDADFVDTENNNIGPGPHIMTGKGALKFVVSLDDSGKVYYKILFGVKS